MEGRDVGLATTVMKAEVATYQQMKTPRRINNTEGHRKQNTDGEGWGDYDGPIKSQGNIGRCFH